MDRSSHQQKTRKMRMSFILDYNEGNCPTDKYVSAKQQIPERMLRKEAMMLHILTVVDETA